jgi:hypothetical protein
MKLQYLGDARDAFKWDLLHWICTSSSFSQLVFVPLLTRDIEGSGEGLTPHYRFRCQEFLRPFLESLKEAPRNLNRIYALGSANPSKQFEVCVFAAERFISSGVKRHEYWSGFDASTLANSVVFFDPDNGYETKMRRGSKWIRHEELKALFARLPESSVALVYQHRPRRRWDDLFADLASNLSYVEKAVAVHQSDLAVVAMANNVPSGQNIANAMKAYADAHHPVVCFTPLF